jgi:hypothetical protein
LPLGATAKGTFPKNLSPPAALGIGHLICFHVTDVGSYIVLFILHKGYVSFLKPNPSMIISPPSPSEGPLLGKALVTEKKVKVKLLLS